MSENIQRPDMLQLAFAVHNNPGVYALLIGSGVSRAAEIPTGWEIVQDLIRQIAAAERQEIDEAPEDWYRKRFKKEPRYDDLLEHLGNRPSERNAILHGYFEPSEEDDSIEIKRPTAAHKAIARLVKAGYIRVIVTTNFDRLIEMALEEINVIPNVVSTDASLDGARPPQHSKITIYKLHGDYQDENFKNVAGELSEYSSNWNHLLDRIIDEYGLIVCGWSGEWDPALRAAIERSKARRYTTFWSSFSAEPSEVTRKVIQARDAQIISNINADDFFNELWEMVEALQKFHSKSHPLSAAIAVERVKKLIPDEKNYIELEDLLRAEIDRCYHVFTSDEFWKHRTELVQAHFKVDEDAWIEQFELHYAVMEVLLHMMVALTWYGKPSQCKYISEAISQVLEHPLRDQWFVQWRFIPSLLLIYVTGIAAVQSQNWEYLPAILLNPKTRRPSGNIDLQFEYGEILEEVTENLIDRFIEDNSAHRDRKFRSIGRLISPLLRPVFQTYVVSDLTYGRAFDLSEMFFSLVHIYHIGALQRGWMPPHVAVWNTESWPDLREFLSESGAKGEDWKLLKTELFGGSRDEFVKALQQYVEIMASYNKDAWATPDFVGAFTGNSEG